MGKVNFRNSVLLLLLGSIAVGIVSGVVAETVSHFDLPFYIRYLVSFFVLSFVVFSSYLVFRASDNLSSVKVKVVNILLGFYLASCLISFSIFGSVSPFVFAGSLMFQASIGTDISTLFYPAVRETRSHEDLKPIIIQSKEKSND